MSKFYLTSRSNRKIGRRRCKGESFSLVDTGTSSTKSLHTLHHFLHLKNPGERSFLYNGLTFLKRTCWRLRIEEVQKEIENLVSVLEKSHRGRLLTRLRLCFRSGTVGLTPEEITVRNEVSRDTSIVSEKVYSGSRGYRGRTKEGKGKYPMRGYLDTWDWSRVMTKNKK